MSNIFAKVASFVRPPKPREGANAYGLTTSEVSALRELSLSKGWQVLGGVIDAKVQAMAETLLSASPEAGIDFVRGEIAGLREVYMLLHYIIKESELENERRKRDEERAEKRRRQSLYATPGWREQFSAYGNDGIPLGG